MKKLAIMLVAAIFLISGAGCKKEENNDDQLLLFFLLAALSRKVCQEVSATQNDTNLGPVVGYCDLGSNLCVDYGDGWNDGIAGSDCTTGAGTYVAAGVCPTGSRVGTGVLNLGWGTSGPSTSARTGIRLYSGGGSTEDARVLIQTLFEGTTATFCSFSAN